VFAGLDHQASLSYLDSRTRSGASRSVGQRTKIAWQSSANWQTGTVQHRLTGLIEGQFETYENDGGPGAGQNQSQSNDQWSGAAEYSVHSGPLVLSLSGRHDENDLFANSDAFRGGFAWNVESLHGKLRGSVGQGVKNPGFFELFGFFPAFFVGNPNLQAEQSLGFDLGWDQQFAHGSASITLFTSTLENEIFTDFGVFPATARNRTSDSVREGIELSGNWDITEHLLLAGSMSFLRSEENGVTEVRRPEFLASFSAFWTDPSDKWQLAVGVDHNGDMQDVDFGRFSRVRLDAYTLVRAKLSYQINQFFSAYVRGENLGDASYSEVFGYQGQERTVYGGLVASF
jgi:vitamin B12 transporter